MTVAILIDLGCFQGVFFTTDAAKENYNKRIKESGLPDPQWKENKSGQWYVSDGSGKGTVFILKEEVL